MPPRVRSDSVHSSSPTHAIVMRSIAAPIGVVVSIQELLPAAQPAAPRPGGGRGGGAVEDRAERAVQPPHDEEVQVVALCQLEEIVQNLQIRYAA